ncbi:MAG TPA: hypothetical protein VLV45_03715 [Gemmatimonadales bacterium]|nr:hypothetical protein [Gemmatimonadales bacterium]
MRRFSGPVVLLSLLLTARGLSAQETLIRGFTDVTAAASDASGAHSTFALGQYDLFITSALAPKWSFLGESVFEFDEDFVVDVERLIISYRPSSHVQIAVGKHHTPFGYWNNAYHHGALMQPTIERPDMFLFEDDGGILPIHTTGLLIAGRDLTPLHLGFDMMVGNGIGSTAISDNNAAKSVTLSLHSQVTHEVNVGVNYYDDRIEPGTPQIYGSPVDTVLPGGDTVATALRQQMFGAYAVYFGRALELMAEYQRITHVPVSGGVTTTNDAFYVYGGYRVGKFVPYVRYDGLLFDAADLYYLADDSHLLIMGGRYDFAATVQIKVEYHHRSTSVEGKVNAVQVQAAIGF